MSHGLDHPGSRGQRTVVDALPTLGSALPEEEERQFEHRESASRSARSVVLDVFRAIAVLLVIGRHMPPLRADAPEPFRVMFGLWKQTGWMGVDLFFVLSGYLVSGLILAEFERTKTFSMKRFLIRRGLKIYPAFYALILTTLAVRLAFGRTVGATALLAELGFVQNYFPGLWRHTWSLAIEEHFYLGISVLFFFTLPRTRSNRFYERFIAASGTLIILILMVRTLSFSWRPFAYSTHVFPTHLRIDALLTGTAIRVAVCRWGDAWARQLARFRVIALPAAIGAISLVASFPLEGDFFVNTVGFTLLSLGFGVLLLLALRVESVRRRPFGTSARRLAGLGAFSYSVYLWHLPVLTWGGGALRRLAPELPDLAAVLILLVACLAVGWAAARVIEFPVLRLRDRLFPRLG